MTYVLLTIVPVCFYRTDPAETTLAGTSKQPNDVEFRETIGTEDLVQQVTTLFGQLRPEQKRMLSTIEGQREQLVSRLLEVSNTKERRLEELRTELNEVSNMKERQLEELRTELDEVTDTKERQLEELRTELTEVTDTKERQLEELRTELNEVTDTKERQLEELRRELNKVTDRKDRQLEELRTELNEVTDTKERQLEELRTELTEVTDTKERQLEELRTELNEVTDTKERQLEELRTELNEVSDTKERLERTFQEQRENLGHESDGPRRDHQSSAVDWIIERNEVQLTDRYLGKGAWGWVRVGIFRGLEVAVKQIHDLILSDYNRELFAREMRMASRCRHPCLLQFIGATSDDGQALLITELLDKNLRSVLSERSLSKEEIVAIALDVSRGLNYLHLNKPLPIIHRDISSANVLLWRRDNCWRAKVSDYGTANFVRQCATIGPGAPLYVAPEALCATRQSPKVYSSKVVRDQLQLLCMFWFACVVFNFLCFVDVLRGFEWGYPIASCQLKLRLFIRNQLKYGFVS